MGYAHNQSLVHIIDFGLANQYMIGTSHIPAKQYTTLTGTARFLSINTHRGIEQSRRDDLESLAYVLIYLLRGSLPWQGLEAKSSKEKYARIMQKKIEKQSKLCADLPSAFSILLHDSQKLPFNAKPNYNYLRQNFRDAFQTAGFVDDNIFDWSAACTTEDSLFEHADHLPSSSSLSDI